MSPSIPVAEEVVDLLHAVNRRIRAAAGDDLQPLGVSPAQARALRVVGRAEPPLRMSELAERLGIARRSATSVVDDLAAAGLVDRRRDPDDGRAVVVAPSPAGRALLAGLRSRRRAAGAALVAGLPSGDRAVLRDLLRRLDSTQAAIRTSGGRGR